MSDKFDPEDGIEFFSFGKILAALAISAGAWFAAGDGVEEKGRTETRAEKVHSFRWGERVVITDRFYEGREGTVGGVNWGKGKESVNVFIRGGSEEGTWIDVDIVEKIEPKSPSKPETETPAGGQSDE